MYSLKVLAHSASGKSVLVSVSKKVGIFRSVIAEGNLRVEEGETLPEVGAVINLEGITSVSTRESIDETSGRIFTWVSLQ